MKSWLRFFGVSFFSDKIAKEAKKRGVMNCVLGLVLAVIFIYCGVLAANTVPFYTHYDNASEFKSLVYGLIDENQFTVDNGLLASDKIIDTFASQSDAEKYGQSGYNLIVDTRPSTALDDFEAYCLSKDGKEEITYEKYLSLTDEEKKNYTFKIRYTANELVLTDKLVAEHESYLNSVEDADVKKQYAELLESKNSASATDYQKSVYSLYIKAYYPDITAYERAGEVPLLRSYYYRNHLNSNEIKKSLFIFDDLLFGFFETDGGVDVTCYGYFRNMQNGALTKDGADVFIKNAYAASVSVSASVYLMNMFRFIPIVAIIPLALALITLLALMLLKDVKYNKYTTCIKILYSYLAWAGLLTALTTFICGFFVSSAYLNILPLIILAAVLLIRTVVLIIGQYFEIKKENAAKAAEAAKEPEVNE